METNATLPRFSEIKKELEPVFPNAKKVDIVNVLNKELVIKDFTVFPSLFVSEEDKKEGKEKNFSVILAELNGELITFNGGEVITEQLEATKEKLPFLATIIKPKGKRYYCLT